MKYPRGSEWRKWDLHFHTPSSYDYDDKSVTNEKIVSTLKNNDISVVVITDHHLIDVERINKLRELAQDDLTVLAGIEFRSELGGSESIHFIGIFPEDSKEFNLQTAWTKLQGQFALTPEEIQANGDDKVYCDLENVCKLIHSLGGLVTIHAGSKSNSIEKITNSLSHKMAQKADIVRNIDIFEMGKISDLEEYRTIVFPALNRPYPMVIASDNHNINNYNLKASCWIKADPAFEGLKQIVYDPEDRVRNQELKPEEKEIYQVIDRVKFIDDNFMPTELLINQNLTVIVGGKSTGKSILLRNIAQAVDSYEVSSRLDEGGLMPYSMEVEGFDVNWMDGQKSDKKTEGVNKKIIYVPQSYLNRLVEKEGKSSAIDKIIEDVLRQTMDEAYDELSRFEKTNKQNIANDIAALFNLRRDWVEQKEKIKNIGDKKGVESEIAILEKQILELKKISGLSAEQIKEYDAYVAKIKLLKNHIERIEKDKFELEALKEVDIFQEIAFDDLSNTLRTKISAFYKQLEKSTVDAWKSEVASNISIQENQLKLKQKELQGVEVQFAPLLDKAKKVASLNEKIKQIETQQDKLKNILNEEKYLESIGAKIKQTISNLEISHAKFYEKYFESKNKILKQDIISGDLTFHLDVQHKTKYFHSDFISEIFDMRQIHKDMSEYKFTTNDDFKIFVQKLIRKILRKEIALKGRYSEQEALTKLLQNWYMFDYQISQGGDSISDMSPGKKSFVLLKLLVELDNSKCPILLDQPEDDLDNRSIYEDLVEFIRLKKKERQIIIVTHNPNLAVGADAECIVVANQDGTYSKNKQYQFEYVSGALENTFINGEDVEILYKYGIREHVCDILEGGKKAFEKREQKYGLKS